MAEVARAAMDERSYVLQCGGTDARFGGVGTVRALLQRVEATSVEGTNSIADGLGGTADGASDGRRMLASGTREDDLAAAKGEGIGRVQARLQGRALVVREWTHKQWRFHPLSSHIITVGNALAVVDECAANGIDRSNSP